MAKPTKRSKPTKAEAKVWLLKHNHKAKPDKGGDYLDLVAEYHNIDSVELKRLLNV